MPDENIASPQPSPTPKPQGNSWKNIIIGVVIGAVLLGVGGFLVYNAYQPKKEEPTIPTTKKATSSAKPSTPSAQKDETADWKTYSGSLYYFKYPANWKVESEKGTEGVISDHIEINDPKSLVGITISPFQYAYGFG